MTLQDLTDLRKRLGLTQTGMAGHMGLSLSAYQEIEGGTSKLRPVHVHAVERAALALAVERREPMLAPASIRRQALDLARMITGEG